MGILLTESMVALMVRFGAADAFLLGLFSLSLSPSLLKSVCPSHPQSSSYFSHTLNAAAKEGSENARGGHACTDQHYAGRWLLGTLEASILGLATNPASRYLISLSSLKVKYPDLFEAQDLK